MWKPLAITIMSGIVFGSFVTLFVIPNIYYDKDKLRHIFKRTFLKYSMYLILPLILTIFLLIISMIFGISTTWVFWSTFIAVFIGFNIRYSFYTVQRWTMTGQTIIQKHLWLKITDLDWNLLTNKPARKRFIINIIFLFWPAILWWIIMILIWLISKPVWIIIWWFIMVTVYLFLLYKSLISIWTNNGQSLTDKISKTKTTEQEKEEIE
jgi:hypothetical protein